MKKLILSLCIAVSTTLYSQDSIQSNNQEIKTLTNFLDAVGHKESTGRYNVASKTGYLGKYQFHSKTLKSIGVHTNKSEFLKSKSIQDDAMVRLMKQNKEALKNEISTFSGKMFKGIMISESGILAAAHLGGAGSVKNFFKFGKDFADGNGTKLSKYLTRFGGYILNL